MVEENLRKCLRKYLFWNYRWKNRKKIRGNYEKIDVDIFLNKYDGQGTLKLKIEY